MDTDLDPNQILERGSVALVEELPDDVSEGERLELARDLRSESSEGLLQQQIPGTDGLLGIPPMQ